MNRAHVALRQLVRPHDARRQQHDDVGLPDRLVGVSEERAEQRDAEGSGEATERPAVLLTEEPGKQILLAVAETERRLDPARAEGGQRGSRHVDVGAEGAVLDGQLEDDLVLVGHPRRHLDDDANRAVTERSERIDGGATGGERRECGLGYRNVLTQIQRQGLALLSP